MKFLLLISGLFLLASLPLIIPSPYYIFTIHSSLLLSIFANYLASCSSQNLKGYETWVLSISLLTHLNSSLYLLAYFLHTYSFFTLILSSFVYVSKEVAPSYLQDRCPSMLIIPFPSSSIWDPAWLKITPSSWTLHFSSQHTKHICFNLKIFSWSFILPRA